MVVNGYRELDFLRTKRVFLLNVAIDSFVNRAWNECLVAQQADSGRSVPS